MWSILWARRMDGSEWNNGMKNGISACNLRNMVYSISSCRVLNHEPKERKMKTLKLKKSTIDAYNDILEKQKFDEMLVCDDCLMCWTVPFEDGVSADLMISRVGTAVFVEVSWYNDCNEEIDHSDISYKLDDEWYEEIDGKDYSFRVVAE